MSCFTVNKLLDAVSSAGHRGNGTSSSKPSPSPKRKQTGSIEILQETLPLRTEETMTKVSSPTVQTFRDAEICCRSPKGFRGKAATTSCSEVASMEVQLSSAISSWKEEVQDLSNRLRHVSSERDYYELASNRMQLEKLRLVKERDDQLDSQSARYEERLVELHSVIAELSRQLEQRVKERIPEENAEDAEEDEEEQEEASAAEESEDDRISVRISEMASRTSTDILDAQAVEAGKRLIEHLSSPCPDFSFLRLTTTVSCANSTGSIQLLALQEELSDAKERNLQLSARLQQREADLDEARSQLEEAAKEKEELRKRNATLEEDGFKGPKMEPKPVTRMAEKRRIRKLEAERMDSDEDSWKNSVAGAEFTTVGVRNSVVAQHLVQDLHNKSSMQELSSSFDPTFFSTDVLEEKMREFEIEMERLSSKIEHLRSQNEVLSLTLQESKNNCDNVTVLIGKYESNHTAQQLVQGYNDHIIDALEVLLALLETELGVLLANCRAAGLHDLVRADDDCVASDEDLVERASENRRAAEAVARRLLGRLETGVARPDSGFSSGLTVNGAWEEATSSTSTSIASSSGQTTEMDLNRAEETRLREFVTQLKSVRSSIQSTVTELESFHCDDEPAPVSINEARTADLEMAVLVQELMAMREERADLRAQVFLMEREKKSMELMINSQQAQELALKSHIQQIQRDLDNLDSENLGISSDEYHRQNRDEMRQRITELLQALEKVKRNSELRQQQQEEVVSDLKRTNATLVESLDRTKKKYQQKLKKLEQQILQSLMQKQFGKNFDLNSQSIHSGVSTETDQTSD